MSFISILILFCFIYFVIIPVYKAWKRMKQAAQQQRDFINSMFGGGPQQQAARPDEDASRRKGGWSKPAARRPSKIDPDVVETARFQEVDDPAPRQPLTETTFVEESQITEAEWTEE